MRNIVLWAAVAASFICISSVSIAQTGPGFVLQRVTNAGPAPKVSQEYAGQLTQLPDMNGAWNYTTPNPRVHLALFDPTHVYIPYEWSDLLPAFGPQPGSYLTKIPYKPEFQKEYMKTVKDATEGRSIDPVGACVPAGMPRLMGGSVTSFDVVETPAIILMQFPYDNSVRKIFMDGRAHPSPKNPDGSDARTYTGHSVGHWEGDTLVVETVNMLPNFYDQTDARTSGEHRMVERIRLLDADTMENQMTIDDPVMFTEPWHVTRIYQRPARGDRGQAEPAGGPAPAAAHYRYLNEGDRECKLEIDMSKGYQTVILPQEREARAKAKPTKSTAAQ